MRPCKQILAVICLILTLSMISFCSAETIHNNPNYEYVFTHRGATSYLDLRTVNVHEYNPPYYQIEGTFVHVTNKGPGQKDVVWSTSCVKRYNYDCKETYSMQNGVWQKDNVSNDSYVALSHKAFANALFRAAYGMNFY